MTNTVYQLVPVCELEKLEEARVHLYEYLKDKLSEAQLLGLTNITGQMWRVANTRKWDNNQHTEDKDTSGGIGE